MAYYLSYVEINEHAALILSEQRSALGPSKIICDVGFSYSPDVSQNAVGYLTTHKGHVREETNASRVLYSKSANAKHRTYEISQAEMAKFLSIINKDRNLNSSAVVPRGDASIVVIVGGPDYQKLTNNCKTYAIVVLKEVGIIEHETLSNFSSKEKAIYTTKIKANELSDGLEQILADLNSQINVQNINEDLKLDLYDLINIVQGSKQSIDENNQAFIKSLEKPLTEDIVEKCAQQKIVIDCIIENLERKLTEYTPRTEETSLFLRYINRIISYLKKDFITIDNTESLIKDSVESLKKSTSAIDKTAPASKYSYKFFSSFLKNDDEEVSTSTLNNETNSPMVGTKPTS